MQARREVSVTVSVIALLLALLALALVPAAVMTFPQTARLWSLYVGLAVLLVGRIISAIQRWGKSIVWYNRPLTIIGCVALLGWALARFRSINSRA